MVAVPSAYQAETRTGGNIIRLDAAIRNPTIRCTAENPIAASNEHGADLEQAFNGRDLPFVRHEQDHMIPVHG